MCVYMKHYVRMCLCQNAEYLSQRCLHKTFDLLARSRKANTKHIFSVTAHRWPFEKKYMGTFFTHKNLGEKIIQVYACNARLITTSQPMMILVRLTIIGKSQHYGDNDDDPHSINRRPAVAPRYTRVKLYLSSGTTNML